MTATDIGLWLIGVGSILVIAGAIISPPDATLGLRFKTRQTTVRQRLVFAVQTTGLALVAIGSLAVALSQAISWWLIALTLIVVVGMCDVLLAWPLKRAWDEKSELATAVASTGGEMAQTVAAQRQAAIGQRCATWRWCLLHPLNSESWPSMSDE
jgi:hypothetical protein